MSQLLDNGKCEAHPRVDIPYWSFVASWVFNEFAVFIEPRQRFAFVDFSVACREGNATHKYVVAQPAVEEIVLRPTLVISGTADRARPVAGGLRSASATGDRTGAGPRPRRLRGPRAFAHVARQLVRVSVRATRRPASSRLFKYHQESPNLNRPEFKVRTFRPKSGSKPW